METSNLTTEATRLLEDVAAGNDRKTDAASLVSLLEAEIAVDNIAAIQALIDELKAVE